MIIWFQGSMYPCHTRIYWLRKLVTRNYLRRGNCEGQVWVKRISCSASGLLQKITFFCFLFCFAWFLIYKLMITPWFPGGNYIKLLYFEMLRVIIQFRKAKYFLFDWEESSLFVLKHKIEVHSTGKRGRTDLIDACEWQWLTLLFCKWSLSKAVSSSSL